jgi:hypothetical protein
MEMRLQRKNTSKRQNENIDKSRKVLLFSLKNGARCRVRTCDPIRVKDVLYH